MITMNSILRLLAYVTMMAGLCACGGSLSTAAPDAMAALDIGEKLNSIFAKSPEAPASAKMAQAPETPEAPALADTAQMPESPTLANMSQPMDSPYDMPVQSQAGRSRQSAAYVRINLHAANYLNVDAGGRSLALITKIYKLKQYEAFQQAPYETFLDSEKEKNTLGTDLVEVKETTLVPGQQYQTKDKINNDIEYIGVVGLFRAPLKGHWRAIFPAKEVVRTGITIGMLGCKLTVGIGRAIKADNEYDGSQLGCHEEEATHNTNPSYQY